MKTATSMVVTIGATTAFAGALAPRASSIPKVTVKGNGMLIYLFYFDTSMLTDFKPSLLAQSVSTFEASTTNPVVHQMLLIPSPTPLFASETLLSASARHLHPESVSPSYLGLRNLVSTPSACTPSITARTTMSA